MLVWLLLVLLVLRSSSQGFLRKGECREFARTVGDNEVVGPIPLSLDWEVFVMVASVDQYEAFGPVRKSRRRTFSYPLLKNGLQACSARSFLIC
jgi:hypothetical protein